MVLKKCHFEDLFKKILDRIEDQFDDDFEKGTLHDLEGTTDTDLKTTIRLFEIHIDAEIFDIYYQNHPSDRAEAFIRQQIVFLLYLYKRLQEESKK